MAQAAKPSRKSNVKKTRRSISSATVHVFASFNNTIITVSDSQGNTVCWSSSGAVGYKGSRKSTPFAARVAAEEAMKKAVSLGVDQIDLIIKGPGPGRESAIRAIQSMGLKVTSIEDITPIPHNGCRPPKKRRV